MLQMLQTDANGRNDTYFTNDANNYDDTNYCDDTFDK